MHIGSCIAHGLISGGLWPRRPLHALQIAFAVLSIIFVIATLLSFRFFNPAVSFLYRLAALWIGVANFLFVGAWIAWLADLVLRLTVSTTTRIADRPYIAATLLVLSIATATYGLVNARAVRVRRITVELPNLPQSWRGRQALLVSDVHLGHVNQIGFARRIAEMARELNPATIFLAGDLFDGSKIDAHRWVAPLLELKPPLGVFFAGGNHEEFGGAAHFEDALRAGGIRVLHHECADVDGLCVAGVPYRQAIPTGSQEPPSRSWPPSGRRFRFASRNGRLLRANWLPAGVREDDETREQVFDGRME